MIIKQNGKNIINPFDNQSLDILLSGPLPPNPLNLVNNGNIDILIKDARKTYDYIIIDSAPTLLVADTQSLINKSDILIFLTRCNVTDNEVLSHIKKISDESETNVGVVLNGIGQKIHMDILMVIDTDMAIIINILIITDMVMVILQMMKNHNFF